VRRILIELLVLTFAVWMLFRFLGYMGMNFRLVGILAFFTVPASIAGELYGRRTGEQVSSGFAWQVAFAGGAMIAVAYSLFFAFTRQPFSAYQLGVITIFGFAVFLLSFLLIRLVFRWGVSFGVRKNPQRFDPGVFD